MNSPKLALNTLQQLLHQKAPEQFALLSKIIEIEELYLSDKGTIATEQIQALIERHARETEL